MRDYQTSGTVQIPGYSSKSIQMSKHKNDVSIQIRRGRDQFEADSRLRNDREIGLDP
jgi:HSP20 family molecular chaperone IbpA